MLIDRNINNITLGVSTLPSFELADGMTPDQLNFDNRSNSLIKRNGTDFIADVSSFGTEWLFRKIIKIDNVLYGIGIKSTEIQMIRLSDGQVMNVNGTDSNSSGVADYLEYINSTNPNYKIIQDTNNTILLNTDTTALLDTNSETEDELLNKAYITITEAMLEGNYNITINGHTITGIQKVKAIST